MADLKLDETGDLAFEDGQLVVIDGPEATAQRLRLKLSTWLGEWYLDERVGVPFVRDWLVKNPNLRLITSQVQELVLADPGVRAINRMALDFNRADRRLVITAEFLGFDGEPFAFEFNDAILGSER